MDASSQRPEPVPDELSQPFWDAVAVGRLEIQRCCDCGKFYYPAVSFCGACFSRDLQYRPVSGRGRVYSYTETVSGARHPYFQRISPYLVGLVELEEQGELFMYTNFPGADLASLSVGVEVRVVFETLESGRVIPQFRLERLGLKAEG